MQRHPETGETLVIVRLGHRELGWAPSRPGLIDELRGRPAPRRRSVSAMPMSLAQPLPNRRDARPEPIAPQPHTPAGREFAHLHPPEDGSHHISRPPDRAVEAHAKGWSEPHPVSATPLIYAPHHEHDLEVVFALLRVSYRYAVGSGQA